MFLILRFFRINFPGVVMSWCGSTDGRPKSTSIYMYQQKT